MATTRQYWNILKSVRNSVALEMGVDPTTLPKDIRAVSNADLSAVGILAKTLVDAGVITDAQLIAHAQAALGSDGSVWDDEPVNP